MRIIDGPLTPDSIKGRAIGVLVADGSDATTVNSTIKAILDAGARAIIVAPKIGGAKLSDGSLLKAEGQLAGSPSALYDAVVIGLADAGTKLLLDEAAAVQFVMDAVGHLKAIGHTPEAQPLLDKAGVKPDDGVVALDKRFVAAAAKRYWDREPKLRMLP